MSEHLSARNPRSNAPPEQRLSPVQTSMRPGVDARACVPRAQSRQALPPVIQVDGLEGCLDVAERGACLVPPRPEVHAAPCAPAATLVTNVWCQLLHFYYGLSNGAVFGSMLGVSRHCGRAKAALPSKGTHIYVFPFKSRFSHELCQQ